MALYDDFEADVTSDLTSGRRRRKASTTPAMGAPDALEPNADMPYPESGPYNPDPVDLPPPAPTTPALPQGTGSASGWGTAGSLQNFNAEKVGNSEHAKKSPKYAFAQVMSNYAPGSAGMQQGLAQLQREYPEFFGNWAIDGRDKIKWNGQGTLHSAFNGGSVFDVWQGSAGGDGQGAWQWHDPYAVDPSAGAGGGGIDAGSGTGTGSGGMGGGGGAAGSSALDQYYMRMSADLDRKAAEESEFRKKIKNTISTRIDGAMAPHDPNDPIIKNQMRTFRGAQDREIARGREAMAERGAAEGMGTGAFDASVQSSYENAANASGAHAAGLEMERHKEKLAELQSLLQTGAGIMDAEQQARVEQEIALLNGRIKELDINTGKDIAVMGNATDNRNIDLGYDRLGFDIGKHASTLDQDMMAMLLGR